jgi:non-homologous end joining protein Ku
MSTPFDPAHFEDCYQAAVRDLVDALRDSVAQAGGTGRSKRVGKARPRGELRGSGRGLDQPDRYSAAWCARRAKSNWAVRLPL